MIGKGDSGESLIVSDTIDVNGGIIRTITGKVVKLQTKTITPTTAVQVVNPDDGYDGFSKVTVEAGGSSVVNNQDKTVSPTTSEQTITADSGYTGLGTVTINAMPVMTLPTSASSSATSGYTSKATISRSTSDQYINIPTGYNSTGGYYKISAIANGAATPAASISGTSASITTGNNTITLTKTVSNTPQVSAGYISSGTSGNSAVSLTASVTTMGAQTITPSTSSVSLQAGTYLTGAVQIDGDSDLVASNIKKNVTIFGVTGTYEAGSSSPTIESLEVTPSETEQTFNDSSIDGYKPVTVGAISSTYIGSGITRRSSTDLTVSGATVTVPAGYYSSQATNSVSTMTLPTSASSSATSGYTSKATISRSTSAQYINIPVGYNSTGAYYVISATPNGSVTAPSSISGTSATVSTGTNTLTLTKTISVTPSVTTAGYISSGTAGNSAVSLTASVTTKAAATITPSTSNQTIASGTYLTGTQTIAGDENLVSSNIVSGKSIFGVSGSVVLQNYYTGSSAPSSSTGSDGDLYLQS